MRELRSLLRRSAEQAGWTGVGAIDASGFRRDQTDHHYRNRANYSFQSIKTTILAEVETPVIKAVHFTTPKSCDGHIRMRVFCVPSEDLQVLLADKGYSWSDLREACREESTRPLINHTEHDGLKKAHNARIDDDVYQQRWNCETSFSMLKLDDCEKLRSRS